MARDNCGLCSGKGTLPCTTCAGMGYRIRDGQHVTCSCSAGRRECAACEGTGRRRLTSIGHATLDENRADDSKAPEESQEAVRAGMDKLRQQIQQGINQCSLLPSALRNNWVDRLANLTDANCVAEVEALCREVKDAYRRRTLFFDH